jgi:hypothetical protein
LDEFHKQCKSLENKISAKTSNISKQPNGISDTARSSGRKEQPMGETFM